MKKIIIEVDNEGNCEIDGQGFVGPECKKFIDEIEQSLGNRTSRIDKREMRQLRTKYNKQRIAEG